MINFREVYFSGYQAPDGLRAFDYHTALFTDCRHECNRREMTLCPGDREFATVRN